MSALLRWLQLLPSESPASPSATWISDQGTWPNPRFPSSPSRILPVTNLASRLEGVGGGLEKGLGGLVSASRDKRQCENNGYSMVVLTNPVEKTCASQKGNHPQSLGLNF